MLASFQRMGAAFHRKEHYRKVMKIYRLIAAAALVAAVAALPIYAQGNGRTASQPSAAAAVPDTRIAFINTEIFADDKQGITRFVNAMRSLEREFQPRSTELTNMQAQIKSIAEDIQKTQSLSDPKALQAKQERGDALQREYEFKKKSADADYQKRFQAVVSPIYEDIGKALDTFAKQRGITMILDISKLAPAVLTVNENMDVTKAFIAEYNSRNPATASR